jgi:hypothetical protein
MTAEDPAATRELESIDQVEAQVASIIEALSIAGGFS